MSNGYQGLVTSFMLKPIQQTIFKTINELLESDVNIELSSFKLLENLDNWRVQKVLNENRVVEFDFSYYKKINWPEEYRKRNIAFMQPCKAFKNYMERLGQGKTYYGLYQIPEPFLRYGRENLFVKPFHPFIDEFQRLMDLSFESGLHIAWERFFNDVFYLFSYREEIKDKEILDANTIAPIFLILIFGFLIAIFAFLCEIFYHDFVLKISKKYLKKKFMNFVRKLKIGEIQVRPMKKKFRKKNLVKVKCANKV